MTRFLLIRHATTNSVGKRLSGRTPGVHLSEAGRAEAEQLADRLAHIKLDLIYSSPLERARETAEPLAKQHGLETVINEDLVEINFGDWTDLSFAELQNDKGFQLFNTFRSTAPVPGGERMPQAQLRIVSGLQSLCAKHPNQTVAVVSHSDLIKSAVAYYLGVHLDLFQRIEISPASVTILEVFEETCRVTVLNNTGDIR
ncbi:MAG: histidine phosphatase family protein [Mucilaginibacter polytrichastri]|nr:histidine phosphatase family protein [Mucilaginibacter polytrichastri]